MQVMKFSFRDQVAMFFRSFAIQGGWNYPRMQGLGFLFILIPWFRKLNQTGSQMAPRRHLGYFNTHPFLAGYIAGVVARMEGEGKGKDSIRARDSLMGPLGALGDGLFWARVRPAAILAAVAVSFFEPWASAPILLLLFNSIHLKERWSAIAAGYTREEEPLGGLSGRSRIVFSGFFGGLILPACGFILTAAAIGSGSPWFAAGLFALGVLLFTLKFNNMMVLGCLLAAALLLGFLGVGMRLPWSL